MNQIFLKINQTYKNWVNSKKSFSGCSFLWWGIKMNWKIRFFKGVKRDSCEGRRILIIFYWGDLATLSRSELRLEALGSWLLDCLVGKRAEHRLDLIFAVACRWFMSALTACLLNIKSIGGPRCTATETNWKRLFEKAYEWVRRRERERKKGRGVYIDRIGSLSIGGLQGQLRSEEKGTKYIMG